MKNFSNSFRRLLFEGTPKKKPEIKVTIDSHALQVLNATQTMYDRTPSR